MLTAINNLREVQQRCTNREPLNPELADWLAQSLQDFLTHRCNSVDMAFGLSAPQGGVPWWLEEGIRKRNAAIQELAKRACPSESPTAQARRIRALSLRYAATGWRRDQHEDNMPVQYAGTDKEPLWHAFKSGAAMPVSERHLRGILAT